MPRFLVSFMRDPDGVPGEDEEDDAVVIAEDAEKAGDLFRAENPEAFVTVIARLYDNNRTVPWGG